MQTSRLPFDDKLLLELFAFVIPFNSGNESDLTDSDFVESDDALADPARLLASLNFSEN